MKPLDKKDEKNYSNTLNKKYKLHYNLMLFLFETYSVVLYENKSAKKNLKYQVVKN